MRFYSWSRGMVSWTGRNKDTSCSMPRPVLDTMRIRDCHGEKYAHRVKTASVTWLSNTHSTSRRPSKVHTNPITGIADDTQYQHLEQDTCSRSGEVNNVVYLKHNDPELQAFDYS